MLLGGAAFEHNPVSRAQAFSLCSLPVFGPAIMVFTITMLVPINNRIAEMNTTHPYPGWSQDRARWNRLHQIRVGLLTHRSPCSTPQANESLKLIFACPSISYFAPSPLLLSSLSYQSASDWSAGVLHSLSPRSSTSATILAQLQHPRLRAAMQTAVAAVAGRFDLAAHAPAAPS
jgi:hypothetical protein